MTPTKINVFTSWLKSTGKATNQKTSNLLGKQHKKPRVSVAPDFKG